MATNLKEAYQITDEHYGVVPLTVSNPYVRGTMISKEVIMKCLSALSGVAMYPVTISPAGK